MIDYLKFKSGTDIRGVAVEGVPGELVNLTDEALCAMTDGFLCWLCEKLGRPATALTVSVGHDSRISAQRIKTAVVNTLCDRGVAVYDCGLSSTPAMFMTTVLADCDAAVQITASHHPFNRNGLKFFTRDGGLSGGDITAILLNAQSGQRQPAAAGSVHPLAFMEQYAAHLRQMIVDSTGEQQPFSGMRIIVDAGNGAGGFYAYDVLRPLGADITGSQFLEPDGRFPNHIPNPENQQAMDSARAATVQAGAQLGIIFDTDVDRAGCVDQAGNEINRNRLVALAAAIALQGHPGATVVTDSVTSAGLKTFIEQQLGGRHHRFKRGYKNVIDEAVRLNADGIDAPLAIETSGHAAFSENYFLDDGAYLITKILIQMVLLRRQGKTIDDLIAGLQEPAEAVELRFNILDNDFKSAGQAVIDGLFGYADRPGWTVAPDNYEGIRVSLGSGWFLLRLSVHDPIMPLNIESDTPGGTVEIARALYGYLQGCNQLDLTPIQAFLQQ